MRISRLSLSWRGADEVAINWQVEGSTDGIDFFLERSASTGGPWELVAGPFTDLFFYLDKAPPNLHRLSFLFYRLRWEGRETGASEPRSLSPKRDPIAEEMARRLYLLLKEFAGRKVLVYPIRTSGARCPTCWDDVRKRRVREHCPTCYGVGFAGGFYYPIQTYMQIQPPAHQRRLSQNGEIVDLLTSAIALPFPPLKLGDVVVEAEGTRWQIAGLQETQKLRATVHYNLQLRMVPSDDVLFRLPVSIEEPSPVREYVRASDVHVLDTLREKL